MYISDNFPNSTHNGILTYELAHAILMDCKTKQWLLDVIPTAVTVQRAVSVLVQLVAYFYLFLIWLTFRPWRWRRYIPPTRRAVSEIHGIIAQKTLLFSYRAQFL
jgi:hypothetical protein